MVQASGTYYSAPVKKRRSYEVKGAFVPAVDRRICAVCPSYVWEADKHSFACAVVEGLPFWNWDKEIPEKCVKLERQKCSRVARELMSE